jgi:hypothetical protein
MATKQHMSTYRLSSTTSLERESRLYFFTDEIVLPESSHLTFTLASTVTSALTTEITVPLNSFNLSASQPLVPSLTHFFPLKCAANSTQYILGRSFLQEAYITADYERRNFSIAQVLWNDSPSKLVSIPPTVSLLSHHSLSGDSIAGIAVGILVVIVALSTLVYFFFFRSKRRAERLSKEKLEQKLTKAELDGTSKQRPELEALEQHKLQSNVEGQAIELPVFHGEAQVLELQGENLPAELDGSCARERVHELLG